MGENGSGVVVVRGAGDLATGVIVRLVKSGYRVVALEIGRPTAIRRKVALSEAVYDSETTVEGVRAVRAASIEEAESLLLSRVVPVLVDPDCGFLSRLRPAALVDAIIAKQNTGTRIDMARVVIALGPGFVCGKDSHYVVETNRGHDLGRVIETGSAQANTGVPGLIGGRSTGRVVYATRAGRVEPLRDIGATVKAGETILELSGTVRTEIVSPLDGVLRGLIRGGFPAWSGMKIADVDPRGEVSSCFSVSDKSRSVGGGVLEALLRAGTLPSMGVAHG